MRWTLQVQSLYGFRTHTTGPVYELENGKVQGQPSVLSQCPAEDFLRNALMSAVMQRSLLGSFGSTPRTQGPDFAAFLFDCRVDAFLNAGYLYDREFEWR